MLLEQGKRRTIVDQQLLYEVLMGSSSIASSPSEVSVLMPCSLCWGVGLVVVRARAEVLTCLILSC